MIKAVRPDKGSTSLDEKDVSVQTTVLLSSPSLTGKDRRSFQGVPPRFRLHTGPRPPPTLSWWTFVDPDPVGDPSGLQDP